MNMHVPRARVTITFTALATVILTVALCLVSGANPALGGGTELTGLWQAKHLLSGPEISGRLAIQRDSHGWSAEIAGVSARVNVGTSAVTFDLPGARGSFAGRW